MKQLLISGALILMLNGSTVAQTINTPPKTSAAFDFAAFKIKKGQLGKIKIGMTIQQAEKHITGLVRKTDDATNFGFGGGSPAYLYYSGNTVVLGLIPKLDTDTLLFIIAADKRLLTTNGLNPNSSVRELMQKYPAMSVSMDLMNNWEVFLDEENDWDFVFMTDENDRVGIYPDPEAPSRPLRIAIKTDWITIR